MPEAINSINEFIKVGGYLLKNIKFAYDQGMLAETEEGLHKILDGLNDVSHEYGMKMNVSRKKVMRISKHGGGNLNIILNKEKIEQVANSCYLGTVI